MSTLRTNTLSNAAGSKSVPVDTVVSGTAKAWVNFNGSGTVAIRGSFNVTSITDNGVGDYTVNFTAAMADANYGAHASASYASSQSSRQTVVNMCTVAGRTSEQAPTTTTIRFTTSAVESGTNYDPTYCFLSIFR